MYTYVNICKQMFLVLRIIFGPRLNTWNACLCVLFASHLCTCVSSTYSWVLSWALELICGVPCPWKIYTFVTSNTLTSVVAELLPCLPHWEALSSSCMYMTKLFQCHCAGRTKLSESDMMIRTKTTSRKFSHWDWNICHICSQYHLCHLGV